MNKIVLILTIVSIHLNSWSQHKLTYSDTLMLRGEKMYKEQDLLGAIMQLDSCILLNQKNDQCRYTRAKIAYDMHNYELSKVVFKSVLALTPKDGVSWNMLGLCFQNLKQYDSAEFCFKNAVATNPEESKFFANWGKNEYLLHNFEHAEQLYNTAIMLDKGYANHYKNRAEVLQKLGKKESAIADIKTVLNVRPNDIEAKQKLEELEGKEYISYIVFAFLFILLLGLLIWRKAKKAV